MLIIAPKSTRAFEKVCPLIFTVTIGFPGSSYLTGASLPDNRSDRVPTTWTVELFVILLLGLKAVYKEVEEESKPVYLLNQCHQWKPRQSGMSYDPCSSFQPLQHHAQQYNTMSGKGNDA